MSVSTVGETPFLTTATPRDESTWSEATRYLAAAAHSDPNFRKSVLDAIDHRDFRCKAPEFGIDEQIVVDECKAAERHWKIRDGLLFAALLVFLLFSGFVQDLGFVFPDHPEDFTLLLQVHAYGLVILLLFSAAVLFCSQLIKEHFILRRRFARPASRVDGRGRSAATPHQNIVVYGGYSPFVGSGLSLRDWSFSVNLHKTLGGNEDDAVHDLSVKDLVTAIQSRIADLAIPGLEQYQVLFVDGRHVRGDSRLMPSPYNLPPRRIPDDLVADCSQDQETSHRSYLCIAVTDWSGEMVLTTYLRFKQGEAHLFAEASSFILPPLKQSYYEIDSMDPALKVRHLLGLLWGSLLIAPFWLAWSPFSVYRIVMQPLHHWSVLRATQKAIRDNPMFNYGALTSIRQLGMENRFRVYFQRLDRDMHQKTVEQCLIDAIVDYLEDHDIDTSDIRERRTAILNNGVIVSGGVVTAESIAAGRGAQSVIAKVGSIASGGSRSS